MFKEQLLILLAILPAIIICRYVYNKDKYKEPRWLLSKLLLSGMLAAILVIIFSTILELLIPQLALTKDISFSRLLVVTFIKIALLEEGMKLLMVYFFGYKNEEFDETYDIIIYSVFVSLGFAAFENIAYVLSDGTITVGIIRGLMAVPAHAFNALFMGYYLSLAKISNLKEKKELEKENIFKSLIIPTILHGIYDFCLLSGNIPLILLAIIFIIFLYIVSINKLNYVVKNNIKLIKEKNINFNDHQNTGNAN